MLCILFNLRYKLISCYSSHLFFSFLLLFDSNFNISRLGINFQDNFGLAGLQLTLRNAATLLLAGI